MSKKKNQKIFFSKIPLKSHKIKICECMKETILQVEEIDGEADEEDGQAQGQPEGTFEWLQKALHYRVFWLLKKILPNYGRRRNDINYNLKG